MRASDLTPLLTPQGLPGVGFRQGQVVTFDPDTGNNTVNVAGAVLTNVPMLNSGEAVALKVGHVVALLTFKSSWWILGRVTLPGSDHFASASVAFAGARNAAFEVTHTPTFPPPDRATAVMNVPPWADEAIIMATADVTGDNTSAQNDDALLVSARIGSVTGDEMMTAINSGRQNALSASLESKMINLTSTIEVACRTRTNIATWSGAGSGNRVAISAIAVFRSTS